MKTYVQDVNRYNWRHLRRGKKELSDFWISPEDVFGDFFFFFHWGFCCLVWLTLLFLAHKAGRFRLVFG